MDIEHLFAVRKLNTKGNQSSEKIRRCVAQAQMVIKLTAELH
jgi:hypothetical protein